MAKKKPATKEEDDDFESLDEDILDEYDYMEFKKPSQKYHSNARRRHEKLKEEKELERLLGNDYNDWDYGSDYTDYIDSD